MDISAGTIARTVCVAAALANQILALAGKETVPFAEDNVYQLVSLIFSVCATLAAWWKNNSFTHAAIKADEFLKKERSQAINDNRN